mgnify:CR=1 FL=1
MFLSKRHPADNSCVLARQGNYVRENRTHLAERHHLRLKTTRKLGGVKGFLFSRAARPSGDYGKKCRVLSTQAKCTPQARCAVKQSKMDGGEDWREVSKYGVERVPPQWFRVR